MRMYLAVFDSTCDGKYFKTIDKAVHYLSSKEKELTLKDFIREDKVLYIDGLGWIEEIDVEED